MVGRQFGLVSMERQESERQAGLNQKGKRQECDQQVRKESKGLGKEHRQVRVTVKEIDRMGLSKEWEEDETWSGKEQGVDTNKDD